MPNVRTWREANALRSPLHFLRLGFRLRGEHRRVGNGRGRGVWVEEWVNLPVKSRIWDSFGQLMG